MARYEIREGSQTAHCCYEWTVIDTAKPILLGPNKTPYIVDGEQRYEPICECWEQSDAMAICLALNAVSEQNAALSPLTIFKPL